MCFAEMPEAQYGFQLVIRVCVSAKFHSSLGIQGLML